MQSTQKNEFLRASQVAKEYPLSTASLWRWVKEGKLSATKVSTGVTVFKRSELESLFNGEA